MSNPIPIFTILSAILLISSGLSFDTVEQAPVADSIPQAGSPDGNVEMRCPASVEESKTFYRSNLSDPQQEGYDAIEECISSSEYSTALPDEFSRDDIKRSDVSLSRDCPDEFWFTGAVDAVYAGEIRVSPVVEARPSYICGRDELDGKKAAIEGAIDSAVSTIRQKLPANPAEKDVRRGVCAYIADTCVYDTTAPHGKSIEGVLIDGRAWCEGYARTAVLLMRRLGVSAVYVIGDADSRTGIEDHAWVLSSDADGGQWWCDPTWFDTSNSDTPIGLYAEKWAQLKWPAFSQTHRLHNVP